jgi:hypothetical protein
MKKVISLATAVIFMAGLAIAQQGPTPAKPVAKNAKKECSSKHKSCCNGKTANASTASKCSGQKKSCCSGQKAEASAKPATTVKK